MTAGQDGAGAGAGADGTTSRRGLLAGLALGVPVMAYAVRGALIDAHLTHPAELARWIVGLALVHDVVAVPTVLAVGATLRRRVPPVAWPPVRAALLTSAVLVVVGWPFVRGYGRNPGVPSLLPRDYAAGVLAALALTWLVSAAWIATRAGPGRVLASRHARRRRAAVTDPTLDGGTA